MNEQMNRPQYETERRKLPVLMEFFAEGVRWVLFSLPRILFWSIVISICIEWTGMAINYWAEPGSDHARATYLAEVQTVNSYFKQSLFEYRPMHFIYMADQWLESFLRPGQWVSSFGADVYNYILAAYFVIKTMVLRCLVIVLSIHVYVIFCGIAVVTGLSERDLRIYGVGHESGDKFELSLSLIAPSIYIASITYLSWPWAVPPSYIIVPAAAFTAYAIHLSLSNYKKRF